MSPVLVLGVANACSQVVNTQFGSHRRPRPGTLIPEKQSAGPHLDFQGPARTTPTHCHPHPELRGDPLSLVGGCDQPVLSKLGSTYPIRQAGRKKKEMGGERNWNCPQVEFMPSFPTSPADRPDPWKSTEQLLHPH